MHEFAQATSILKLHGARDLGKERIILADSHIQAGFELGAPLPNDDCSAVYQLAGEALDAQPLGLAISSVTGAPDSFFVCHTNLLACYIDFFDANFRMLLTMSARAAILLLCLILKDKNRIILILGFQLARYRGALHQWLANVGLRISLYQEYLVEFDRGSWIDRKLFYANEFSFGDTVLLSAAHYHCIHGLTSLGRNRRFNQEAAKKATTKHWKRGKKTENAKKNHPCPR